MGKPNELPNILICYKSEKPIITKSEERKRGKGKRSKSRELRCGILYIGCECERRNGLQDSCPRTECQGAPECMTVPPTCPPSEFAQAKHIAKAYKKLEKERAEFAKQSGGSDKKGAINSKVDYDCFPLDELMANGGPCPLCEKPMDGCIDHPPKEKMVAIEFDSDCLCCPSS